MDQVEFGPPDEQMQATPKRGMSGGAKTLIILGIVFGGLIVLCCGGIIGYFAYYAGNMLSEDADTIARLTQEEIVQIDIPEELAPRRSMNITIPFSANFWAGHYAGSAP